MMRFLEKLTYALAILAIALFLTLTSGRIYIYAAENTKNVESSGTSAIIHVKELNDSQENISVSLAGSKSDINLNTSSVKELALTNGNELQIGIETDIEKKNLTEKQAKIITSDLDDSCTTFSLYMTANGTPIDKLPSGYMTINVPLPRTKSYENTYISAILIRENGATVSVPAQIAGGFANIKTREFGLYAISVTDTCKGGIMCPSSKFSDVSPDNPYHSDVDYVVINGYMSGVSNTEFALDADVSRAMLITILWRMDGGITPETTESPFSDVDESSYYFIPLMWGYENKLISGRTNNLFEPDSPVSREDMATIFRRFLLSKSGSSDVASYISESYLDGTSISKYAKDAVVWSALTGILNTEDGYLFPKRNATRAEVAHAVTQIAFLTLA